jgi:hypothetical protein
MAVVLKRNHRLGLTLVVRERMNRQFAQLHGPQDELDDSGTRKRGEVAELQRSLQSSQSAAAAAILCRSRWNKSHSNHHMGQEVAGHGSSAPPWSKSRQMYNWTKKCTNFVKNCGTIAS